MIRIADALYNPGTFNAVWEQEVKMVRGRENAIIELGMKVSVRRSNRSHVGVVTKLAGEYVIVRWTNSDLGETEEYQAHRDDVMPLAGWL